MSRIWQALRSAERERARARASQTSSHDVVEIPDGVIPDIESIASATIGENSAGAALDDDRRQALRHAHRATVLVYGSGPDKQPFHEQCETIDANEGGCLLSLANEVARGQRLFLTNMRNSAEQECRVVYIGRKTEGKLRIGVEFLKPAPHFWRLTPASSDSSSGSSRAGEDTDNDW